jgi:ketosteroid isomerase-like protein
VEAAHDRAGDLAADEQQAREPNQTANSRNWQITALFTWLHTVEDPTRAGLRDTCKAMSEESTTPDLVELTRRQFVMANRRDMDAVVSRCTPDCVYDTSPDGMGQYDGPAAIRAFISGWWDAFDELALEPEDILDLGHGIVFSVVGQKGRPASSTGRLQRREAYVVDWAEDMIRRVTVYTDIDEGRAAAGRLAAARG